MKSKFCIVLFAFTLLFTSCTEDSGPVGPSAPTGTNYSIVGLLNEMNSARSNPAQYAAKLEKMLPYFNGKVYKPPGNSLGYTTVEGKAAVEEAINFLKNVEPIKGCSINDRLNKAAQRHANDQEKNGGVSHTGSDGSTLLQRVEGYGTIFSRIGENIAYGYATNEDVIISLIVDDGVSNRGHRANIFSTNFELVGFGYAKHPVYNYMVVQVFGQYK